MIVSGRVQGVGFRYFVKSRAVELGIIGFVRNLSDGRVEIEANADAQNIDQFITDIRTGTAFSQVFDIDITDRLVSEERNNFLIEY